MTDWLARKDRYQRDPPPVQLGGLASNVSRIAWHAKRATPTERSLFRESKYFTEWAAPGRSLEEQALLGELQLQLALWERGWGTRFSHDAIAQGAQEWSTRLLKAAGLVDR
jgi:hypothetical protein